MSLGWADKKANRIRCSFKPCRSWDAIGKIFNAIIFREDQKIASRTGEDAQSVGSKAFADRSRSAGTQYFFEGTKTKASHYPKGQAYKSLLLPPTARRHIQLQTTITCPTSTMICSPRRKCQLPKPDHLGHSRMNASPAGHLQTLSISLQIPRAFHIPMPNLRHSSQRHRAVGRGQRRQWDRRPS